MTPLSQSLLSLKQIYSTSEGATPRPSIKSSSNNNNRHLPPVTPTMTTIPQTQRKRKKSGIPPNVATTDAPAPPDPKEHATNTEIIQKNEPPKERANTKDVPKKSSTKEYASRTAPNAPHANPAPEKDARKTIREEDYVTATVLPYRNDRGPFAPWRIAPRPRGTEGYAPSTERSFSRRNAVSGDVRSMRREAVYALGTVRSSHGPLYVYASTRGARRRLWPGERVTCTGRNSSIPAHTMDA